MVDETEQTQQDSLENQPSPEGQEGTTPEQEPETYTKAQLDKAILDAKAAWGREVKPVRDELDTLRKLKQQAEDEVKETRQRMEAHQSQIDKLEEQIAKGSPDSLDVYQQKKRLRELERSLEDDRRQLRKDQLQFESDREEMAKYKKQREVESIASEFGLTVTDLDDFRDLPGEKIRVLAQRISPKKAKPTPQIPGKPASGVTKGSASYTSEQLEKMSPEEYAKVPQHLRDAAFRR